MERLECKTCGAESMVPMNVMLDDDGGEDSPLPDDSFVGDYDDPEHFELMGGEQESRFYTCHGITFVHQMGTEPQLKRVAQMETPVLIGEDTVEEWEYYFDDDPVGEEDWKERLSDRRDVLKSVCMN
ncbi:MAG: hypothetical protein BRD52_00900 [Bacteroidetes bacterium SW_4_67_19]|nr:MAG: hypothetical protein BRD52_00900 [Bacteroidetes bacterium SW_4_67_19]